MAKYNFIIDGKAEKIKAKNNGIFVSLFRDKYPKFSYLRLSDLNIKIDRL